MPFPGNTQTLGKCPDANRSVNSGQRQIGPISKCTSCSCPAHCPSLPVLLEPRPRWSQDPPLPRGSSNLHANVTAVSSPLYFVAATKPWHFPGTRVPAVRLFFLSKLPPLQFSKEGFKNPFLYSILSLGRFLTGNKNILLFYLF